MCVRVFLGLCVLMSPLFGVNIFAQQPDVLAKPALFASFNGSSWPISIWTKAGSKYIEVCDDVCGLVFWETKNGRPDNFAWDTLFLYMYHFGSSEITEKFRVRNKALASRLAEGYSDICPNDKGQRSQAQCIMNHLTSTHSMTIAGVRYDEGFRCVLPFSPLDMKPKAGGGCIKLRKY